MCAGALMLARVKRLVFGVRDERAGGAGSVFPITSAKGLNHFVEVVAGVKETEARDLLQNGHRHVRRRQLSSARSVAFALIGGRGEPWYMRIRRRCRNHRPAV